jgi:hypothetical protein
MVPIKRAVSSPQQGIFFIAFYIKKAPLREKAVGDHNNGVATGGEMAIFLCAPEECPAESCALARIEAILSGRECRIKRRDKAINSLGEPAQTLFISLRRERRG